MVDQESDDAGNTDRLPDPEKSLPHDERRGSTDRLGGRRGSDRRGSEGGPSKGDDENDQGEGNKDDESDKDDNDDPNGDEAKEAKPSPLKKPGVRIGLVVVAIVAIIALAWWAIYYFTHGRYIQSTNDAYIEADKVEVSARVSATVERIDIADNQYVQAGQLLLEMDNRANRAKVVQGEAAAAQARAEASQFRSQIEEQEATVQQSVAQLRGAQVQRDYYAGEAKRYAPLVASGAEKEEKLAELLQSRDKADAEVRQYQANELAARRRINTLSAQVAQSAAKILQGDAQAREAGIDVQNATVRASIAGRIGDREVFSGMYVQQGKRMMTIIPIDAIYVEANFKETQIGLMRIGQPATIEVDALDGMKVSGTIESFSPATGAEFAAIPPQNATGNFTKIVQRVPVRIRLDAGPEARRVLIPGLSVVVDVDTVGDKDDVERRKREAKDRKDGEARDKKESVERDREHREPGAGG